MENRDNCGYILGLKIEELFINPSSESLSLKGTPMKFKDDDGRKKARRRKNLLEHGTSSQPPTVEEIINQV